MKTKFYYLFMLAFALAFSANNAHAQSAPILLQFWDFNNIRPVSVVKSDSVGTSASYTNTAAYDSTHNTWPLTADYTVAGLSQGHILYSRPQKRYGSSGLPDSICDEGTGGAFIYDYSSSHYTYFTKSDSGGVNGNAFIRSRNPSDSAIFYLSIPTTGYKDISMQYAISTSSSGAAQYNILSYSTNGGASWKNLTTKMDTFNISGVYRPDTLLVNNTVTAASGWYPVQINFTSDTTVNNNPAFILRWMIAGSFSSTASHNDRYDNIAVWAASPNGINELPAQEAGYNMSPNPANNSVIINGTYNGSKEITIYNILGQSVSSVVEDQKQISMDVSGFDNGVYFVNIKETATGKSFTMKLVKN